jgi:hypothetical protein
MSVKKIQCKSCYKLPLSKDEIGISKKILGRDTRDILCLDCLSSYLDCTVEELLEKIEEFKEEGCTFFK